MTGEAWRYLGPVPPRPTNLFAPPLFLWLLRILWVALAVVAGFAVDDATNGYELWKSNGTSAGTVAGNELLVPTGKQGTTYDHLQD